MSRASNHLSVAVVGGGQAGLSISYYLKERGVRHLVFEKNRAMHVWSTRRWDSFCLVTPNWQCQLPGRPYDGDDPDGFMVREEILGWLDRFKAKLGAPLREGVAVQRVTPNASGGYDPNASGGYDVVTSDGDYTADNVVVASGGYVIPIVPRMAERIPKHILQLHSEQYRNPQSLPAGAVLVVGSGQSGAQIAEDLHLAGRRVHLAIGAAPRCARFYRGRDVVKWLAEMNYYDMPVEKHPLKEGVRDNTNHYVTGRDGGRDIDLRKFASEGMKLYGQLQEFDGRELSFAPTLRKSLDEADKTYNGINAAIDKFIAEKGLSAPPPSFYRAVWEPADDPTSLDLAGEGVGSIVWCIGFQPDFRWLDVPVFNGAGQPKHHRGVTQAPGVYFLGLPWLHTWGSGRFSGVARDAQFIADHIAERSIAFARPSLVDRAAS